MCDRGGLKGDCVCEYVVMAGRWGFPSLRRRIKVMNGTALKIGSPIWGFVKGLNDLFDRK